MKLTAELLAKLAKYHTDTAIVDLREGFPTVVFPSIEGLCDFAVTLMSNTVVSQGALMVGLVANQFRKAVIETLDNGDIKLSFTGLPYES